LSNSDFLKLYAEKLDSKILDARRYDNASQAGKLEGVDWQKYRKEMRRLQFADDVQQSY
jgi:hypothetical protein